MSCSHSGLSESGEHRIGSGLSRATGATDPLAAANSAVLEPGKINIGRPGADFLCLPDHRVYHDEKQDCFFFQLQA
jgi:hypothetical protein